MAVTQKVKGWSKNVLSVRIVGEVVISHLHEILASQGCIMISRALVLKHLKN